MLISCYSVVRISLGRLSAGGLMINTLVRDGEVDGWSW